MNTVNITAYQFIALDKLTELRTSLFTLCESLNLLGTILISEEGINIMLSGRPNDVRAFQAKLGEDARFTDLAYKESVSLQPPYRKLLIKIKREVIAFGQPVDSSENGLSHISPGALKQWLDEGREIELLDTRNEYEVRLGSFEKAKSLKIRRFSEFPNAIAQSVKPNKAIPIVMYCTGGIRCEKALPYLCGLGYREIYQLDGGILNYFAQTSGEHWQGECFVFDERVGLNATLQETGAVLCENCQSAVTVSQQSSADYLLGRYCPYCIESMADGSRPELSLQG